MKLLGNILWFLCGGIIGGLAWIIAGTFSFLVNLIWILFFGWGMALGNIVLGCMWCITIVGIPFGKQFFKMARLSFMPFGANVL